jgi:hypothetical protein
MKLAFAAAIAALLLLAAVLGARLALNVRKEGGGPGGTEAPAGAGADRAARPEAGSPGAGREKKGPAGAERRAGTAGDETVPPTAGANEAPPGLQGMLAGDAEVIFLLADAGGRAAEGAVVTLLSGRSSAESPADRTGAAAFPGIAAGVYSYRLRWGDLPEVEGAKELTVHPGERREVPITLGSFDLSIGGRVTDRAGEPAGGITIVARKLVSDADTATVIRADQDSLRAESGEDGRYLIGGLDDGDYVLSTLPGGGHPAVRKVYRAGSQSADLILDALREIVIRGVVTSRDGRPIEGARVVALGQPDRPGSSDGGGLYEIRMEVAEGQTASFLHASRSGYREARVQFRLDEAVEGDRAVVDIVLDPLGPRASVAGVVVDAAHVPIAGETVHLHSASLNVRYQASSGGEGQFSFGEVQVADDYRLWIHSRQGYRDYSRSGVQVPAEGLDIEIQLERLETAGLRGTMVDPGGRPIPRFTLWIRSLNAIGNSIAATSDAAGSFEVDGVPEGDLQLETRSLPRFTVRGIRAVPGSTGEATIVLDWGAESLSGVVEDDAGAPLPGANVTLDWSLARDGVTSTSWRSAVTDAAGRFSFSELAPGDHKVTVNAAGFVPAHATHDVGSVARVSPTDTAPEPRIRLKRRT